MKLLALCTSGYSHQLDHLVPLCFYLNTPLILTDPQMYSLSQKYYPFTDVQYLPEKECSLEFLAKNADLLVLSSKHWAKELSNYFKHLYQKNMRFCYAPHGNSDKGSLRPSEDLLFGQDLSFIYGNHMKEMLEKRGVLSSLQGVIVTGNYRYDFYKKHKFFFDALAKQEVFSLFKNNHPILLYAPTWQDPEKSTSFFQSLSPMLDSLPDHFNLLIKLHPNLQRDDPALVYHLIGKYEEKKNVVFLCDYPLVYPLLSQVRAYVGDFSSVGYDFLCFNKPLFFINHQKRDPKKDAGLALFACGKILDPSHPNFFKTIENELSASIDTLQQIRLQTYQYTFDSLVDFSSLKNQLIETALKTSY